MWRSCARMPPTRSSASSTSPSFARSPGPTTLTRPHRPLSHPHGTLVVVAMFKNLFSKLFGGSPFSDSASKSPYTASSASPKASSSSFPATPPVTPTSLADTLDLSEGETPWLIIGLGNPGARYETTRHNIGYMAVDRLLDSIAEKTSAAAMLLPEESLNSLIFATRLDDQPVIVARANTFMNLSGESIGAIAREFSIPAKKVVVIHDELDLPPGQVRVKVGGGENGHNGLKSTTEALGTRDYVRLRMGIGRPPQGTGVVEHVLASFTDEEAATWLPEAVDRAAEGAYIIATQGLSAAQNTVNTKR